MSTECTSHPPLASSAPSKPDFSDTQLDRNAIPPFCGEKKKSMQRSKHFKHLHKWAKSTDGSSPFRSSNIWAAWLNFTMRVSTLIASADGKFSAYSTPQKYLVLSAPFKER